MKKLFLIFSFIFLFVKGYSIEAENAFLQDSSYEVSIALLEQHYYIGEPIQIEAAIKNISDTSKDILVSPALFETIFFEIKTTKSEKVSPQTFFIQGKSLTNTYFYDYRTITLEPGEKFSWDIDLAKWFDFKQIGDYYIRALFYPIPKGEKVVYSSYYRVFLSAPEEVEKNMQKEELKKGKELENLQTLPPYDIIKDLFNAQMKKDWDRFFYSLDLDKLISSFSSYKEKYDKISTPEQYEILMNDFKLYLTHHWGDTILDVNILKTVIENDQATVEVEVTYPVRKQTKTLNYSFKLYQNRDGRWVIYDYIVFAMD